MVNPVLPLSPLRGEFIARSSPRSAGSTHPRYAGTSCRLCRNHCRGSFRPRTAGRRCRCRCHHRIVPSIPAPRELQGKLVIRVAHVPLIPHRGVHVPGGPKMIRLCLRSPRCGESQLVSELVDLHQPLSPLCGETRTSPRTRAGNYLLTPRSGEISTSHARSTISAFRPRVAGMPHRLTLRRLCAITSIPAPRGIRA